MIRNIRQTLKRIEILIFVFWKGQQGLGYRNDIGFPSHLQVNKYVQVCTFGSPMSAMPTLNFLFWPPLKSFDKVSLWSAKSISFNNELTLKKVQVTWYHFPALHSASLKFITSHDLQVHRLKEIMAFHLQPEVIQIRQIIIFSWKIRESYHFSLYPFQRKQFNFSVEYMNHYFGSIMKNNMCKGIWKASLLQNWPVAVAGSILKKRPEVTS